MDGMVHIENLAAVSKFSWGLPGAQFTGGKWAPEKAAQRSNNIADGC